MATGASHGDRPHVRVPARRGQTLPKRTRTMRRAAGRQTGTPPNLITRGQSLPKGTRTMNGSNGDNPHVRVPPSHGDTPRSPLSRSEGTVRTDNTYNPQSPHTPQTTQATNRYQLNSLCLRVEQTSPPAQVLPIEHPLMLFRSETNFHAAWGRWRPLSISRLRSRSLKNCRRHRSLLPQS